MCRIGLDAGFHHAHIMLGDGERALTLFRKTMERRTVIASAYTAYIHIIIDCSHLLTNGFCTGNDRGVVVKPRHPMVNGLRTLVGDKAHHNLASGTDLRDNDTQRLLHGHIPRAALLAVPGEYAVKHLVMERMVHL